MCVLSFDAFNGYFLSKDMSNFTVERKWRSQNFDFLWKIFWINALALKSKKVQYIFWETFILALPSSVAFRLQNHASDFF